MAGEKFDFQLRVTRDGQAGYQAQVRSSPAGQTEPVALPTLDPLRITALRSELAANPTETAETRLGGILFEMLFASGIRALFFRSVDMANAQKSGVRLALDIEPNELSSLPWELLFNPRDKEFVARFGKNSVFRYLPMSQAPRLRNLKLPLRVLALFSSPGAYGLPALDVKRERQVMAEAMAPLVAIGGSELIVLEHATLQSMVETLEQTPIDIFYYQGHTGYDPNRAGSYLLLEGDRGDIVYKWVELLSNTLRQTAVSMAIINSEGMSSGDLAYEMVRSGFSTVVATQEPLDDDETLTFIRQFLLALAEGYAIDSALTQARQIMAHTSGPTARWSSPLLVTRLAQPWLLTPEAQL